LCTLPLDPFDAYLYGKSYNLQTLIQQSEDHVLRRFPLFLDSHYAELVAREPSAAVDLVKAYVHREEKGERREREATHSHVEAARPRTFREWLASGDAIPKLKGDS